ncbi:MAG TPA: RNA polymerase sigma factor [Myxococcaceae bacterium]|nr:RNA polymerase sigma factor [Myxococcaceae bacterium]
MKRVLARQISQEVTTLEGEIERLHPASYGWALACCRFRRQEAEDVLQSAYLKVLDGRARYDGRSSVRTWLFGVIRKTALDVRRRRWLEAMGLLRWNHANGAVTPVVPLDEVGNHQRRSRILRALSELPRRQREVLDLVFYHGMTIAEAAEVMGVSLGAARVHYDRGKRRLGREFVAEDRS